MAPRWDIRSIRRFTLTFGPVNPVFDDLTCGALFFVFPFTPLIERFKFTPLPPSFVIVMGLIVGLHGLAADMMKRIFYRRTKLCSPRPF